MTIEVPNLDAMEADELREFAEVYVGSDLARYARNLLNAKSFRLAGYIDKALMYEDACDEIYKSLKPCQKW